MDILKIRISKDDLLGRSGGRSGAKSIAIFVAYRMNDPTSILFREQFEANLAIHRNINIVDGRVADGDPWAEEIRRRIKKARLVVADVTGPSKEVVFELGAAGAKPYLPTVQSDQHRLLLPAWLTAFQIPTFDGPEVARIAETAWEKVSSPHIRSHQRKPAVPGIVTWLQNSDSKWAEPIFGRLENLCHERSLNIQRVFPEDLTSFTDLREYQRSWLVIGCADGGIQDYAMHYFAGDIVSRSSCGTGKGAGQKIRRSMIFVCPDHDSIPEMVADSVSRVPKNLIETIVPEKLIARAKHHLDRYRRWLR